MSIRTVEDESTLDEALQLPTVVLAKHSTRCFISTRAMRQVTKFADSNPDVPVYQLDIIGHPELSGRVSTVLEVPHVWSDSHFGITEKAIAKGIELSR
jgi:bacillithiol system protein YtxJ